MVLGTDTGLVGCFALGILNDGNLVRLLLSRRAALTTFIPILRKGGS
jgi:hypothetical protein